MNDIQSALNEMKLKLIPISKINAAPFNPRECLMPGDPEYESLKRSIAEHTLVDPLIWNSYNGNLIGGHQRYNILVDEFKVTDIPCITLFIKDPKREMALNLALNRIGGRFSPEKLRDMFREIGHDNLLLESTGFSEIEREEFLTWNPSHDDILNGAESMDIDKSNKALITCPKCNFEFSPKKSNGIST